MMNRFHFLFFNCNVRRYKLAKKKIYPAIFALFYDNQLPKEFVVFGYARSKMTLEVGRGQMLCADLFINVHRAPRRFTW